MIVLPPLRGSLFHTIASGETSPPLQNLSMWFKAGSGVYSGSVVPPSGSIITAWSSSCVGPAGTSGATAAIATAPLYKTNAVNGYPSVRMDASDFMTIAENGNNHTIKNYTIWMVAKFDTISDYRMIVTKGSNAWVMEYEWRIEPSGKQVQFFGDINSGVAQGNPPVTASAWNRLYAVKDATTTGGSSYVNNILCEHDTNMYMTDYSGSNVFLGKRYDGYSLVGEVAEWGFYLTALDDTTRQQLDDYIKAKYGI